MSKIKTFLSFVLKIMVLFFVILGIVNIKNVYNFIMADGLFIMANPNFGKSEYVIKFIYVPFKIMFALVFAIYGVFILSKVCKTADLKTNLIYLSVFAFLLIANGFLETYTIKYSNQQHNIYLYQILKNYTNDKIRYDEKSTNAAIDTYFDR